MSEFHLPYVERLRAMRGALLRAADIEFRRTRVQLEDSATEIYMTPNALAAALGLARHTTRMLISRAERQQDLLVVCIWTGPNRGKKAKYISLPPGLEADAEREAERAFAAQYNMWQVEYLTAPRLHRLALKANAVTINFDKPQESE